MKFLVGSIIQESNTFSPRMSSLDAFKAHLFTEGDDSLHGSVDNELKGFAKAAAECKAEVIPTLSCAAVSAGILQRDAFEQLRELVIEKIQSVSDYDGVFFALHGALTAEGFDDADGELIAEIRRAIGDKKPFVVSLDSHANMTQKMLQHVDAIVGYRTFPHIDIESTGYRAAMLLHELVQTKKKMHIALCKVPMIVPAENGQTTRGPLAELWEQAELGERRGDSRMTSLFMVQPWLDIQEMGCAAVVIAYDRERAMAEAARLGELMWKARDAFQAELHPVEEVITLALQDQGCGEPFIVSDSADSPGAGATGDSNAVLKALLTCGADLKLNCLLTMVDAPAVAKMIEAGVGNEVELGAGYTINVNADHGTPIKLRGTVRRIGDGRFVFSSGFIKGLEGHMGRCAVLQIGNISVLFSEKAAYTGDPNMYRSMGLEPKEADLVLVKSANQFRSCYEPITSRIYIVDTPGCSSANLKSLPFQRLERPMYPLDEHFEWTNTIRVWPN